MLTGDFEAKIQENPKWKCALCKNFAQTGHCNKANCDFAHGEQELRSENIDSPRILRSNYKTVMCNNWVSNGHCFHEDSCTFAHGEEELQKTNGSRDVATTLKMIRGNAAAQGIRKRPTAAMSQSNGVLGGMPYQIGFNAAIAQNDANEQQKLFAEFLEFKKFKESTVFSESKIVAIAVSTE